MSSLVEICNLALSRVGSANIQSIDEPSKEARQCKLFMPNCREATLRAYDWGFARKRQTLALTTEVVEGWDFAYQYPVDCIEVRSVYDDSVSVQVDLEEDTETLNTSAIEYEVACSSDLSKKLILTDKADAVLIYTAKAENPIMYDALFVDALAWRLASELVVPLKSKPALQQTFYSMFLRTVSTAAANNANEGERRQTSGAFVGARK